LEEPELLIGDIRRFFRPLRGDGTRHAAGRSAEPRDTPAPALTVFQSDDEDLLREMRVVYRGRFMSGRDSDACDVTDELGWDDFRNW
jgi:hypothetical protein